MPSILTLAKMEQNGLGFDLKLAMSFRTELQKKQDTLLKKAHQLAGRKFNIMSSKDLSRVSSACIVKLYNCLVIF